MNRGELGCTTKAGTLGKGNMTSIHRGKVLILQRKGERRKGERERKRGQYLKGGKHDLNNEAHI